MANLIQAIRGMNDILPADTSAWQYVENNLRIILSQYGYDEIRLPIVEKTELFKRSIGEATDIVEKEMYTFQDRNEDSLTLRPEGTAGCVRAGIEHGLFYHQTQRLWYMGPYFRHERPQKGRYRQFHQCGVEAFGFQGPDIDAEMILLSARILRQLGLSAHVVLQLNSLGTPSSRLTYREKLVAYLSSHKDQLDEDSQRRLLTNPLRILDSKNPSMKALIEAAPRLIDYLDDESAQHFTALQQFLTKAGLKYTLNPCLVRGLDYYNKTVFEWVTHDLGAQGTVLAGGRYDGLIEQLGGEPTPALGFAIGLERLILLLQMAESKSFQSLPDIYFITDNEASFQQALELADELRQHLGLRVLLHCGGGSFKSQFKKADKSGAYLTLILGEQELKSDSISVKFLREAAPQITISKEKIVDYLRETIKFVRMRQPI